MTADDHSITPVHFNFHFNFNFGFSFSFSFNFNLTNLNYILSYEIIHKINHDSDPIEMMKMSQLLGFNQNVGRLGNVSASATA